MGPITLSPTLYNTYLPTFNNALNSSQDTPLEQANKHTPTSRVKRNRETSKSTPPSIYRRGTQGERKERFIRKLSPCSIEVMNAFLNGFFKEAEKANQFSSLIQKYYHLIPEEMGDQKTQKTIMKLINYARSSTENFQTIIKLNAEQFHNLLTFLRFRPINQTKANN